MARTAPALKTRNMTSFGTSGESYFDQVHFCTFSCMVSKKETNDEDRAFTEDVEATSDSKVFPKMMHNSHRKCLTCDIGIYIFRFLPSH